jgi:hypothetical protein
MHYSRLREYGTDPYLAISDPYLYYLTICLSLGGDAADECGDVVF